VTQVRRSRPALSRRAQLHGQVDRRRSRRPDAELLRLHATAGSSSSRCSSASPFCSWR